MYSYALLENGCHYLIQEKEDSPITLIQVTVESDHCLYITMFGDDEAMVWRRQEWTVRDQNSRNQ